MFAACGQATGTVDLSIDSRASFDQTIVITDMSNDGSTSIALDGGCTPPLSHNAIPLADFDDGTIPDSDTMPRGFRGSDVLRGTIIHPGAEGTAAAVEFSFASDNSVFYQGNVRPRYLDGTASYQPDLANALEFDLRIPAGSSLLASSGGPTFSIFTYHWKQGDPWVGPNATGGNLTDSQMHGYGSMRFDPAGAGRWLHVTMAAAAFQQSRGNYHFYAGSAVVEDLSFFAALRQFQLVYEADRSAGPMTLDVDQLQLTSIPQTAWICPQATSRSVSANNGDFAVPITIVNSTNASRSYRAFLSSVIGVDRQTLETAMHDADDVHAIDTLQAAVNSDGGLGAASLFADDGTGHATGVDLIANAKPITIAAGGAYSAVIVHHVTPAMLGPMQTVANAGFNYTIRRDTLTTSLILWDPSEPSRSDPAVIATGSNSDTSHPAPPGFPQQTLPPTGWRSTDVPPDQAGAHFVSILRLTP